MTISNNSSKSQLAYFDNNATAFLDPRIQAAIAELPPIGNPSSTHSFGQAAKAILANARREVAGYLNVKQSQIIFTSGGSEGAFTCIRGFLKKICNTHIISSCIEHPCVYETLEALKKEGAKVTYLPVGLKGFVDPDDLKRAITPETSLITIMAVNNETGVKQDIKALASLAKTHKIPFISDGVALLGKEVFEIPEGVSAMFFSGHKIHALQGSGFIYLGFNQKLLPSILGGSQEFKMRGGTENMVGIFSLGKAIALLKEEGVLAIQKMESIRNYFENTLLTLPGVKVNGTGPRICNTSNLCFENADAESLFIALDQAGIAVSLGSACSSGAIEPSRVLLEMGLSLSEARSSLRFSFSRMNTMEEIEKAVQAIKNCLFF